MWVGQCVGNAPQKLKQLPQFMAYPTMSMKMNFTEERLAQFCFFFSANPLGNCRRALCIKSEKH